VRGDFDVIMDAKAKEMQQLKSGVFDSIVRDCREKKKKKKEE
jgi:hypothetical protein